MKSHLTAKFIDCFQRLPDHTKRSARRSYQLWQKNPKHPSLQFKRVGKKRQVYSVRVGIGWRALGVKYRDVMVWFWIGSHAEYDSFLKQL
ncbi:MAG: hypothetical protein ABIL62_17475 [Planctomycetota bacterium]